MPEPLSELEVPVESQPEGETTPEVQALLELLAKRRAPAVSVDDFATLEERVLRAVALVKQQRQAGVAEEARAERAEAALDDQVLRTEQMKTEIAALRVERNEMRTRAEQAEAARDDQVSRNEQMKTELSALRLERNEMRKRIERLLVQLDALELSGNADLGRRSVKSILELPVTEAGAHGKTSAATG